MAQTPVIRYKGDKIVMPRVLEPWNICRPGDTNTYIHHAGKVYIDLAPEPFRRYLGPAIINRPTNYNGYSCHPAVTPCACYPKECCRPYDQPRPVIGPDGKPTGEMTQSIVLPLPDYSKYIFESSDSEDEEQGVEDIANSNGNNRGSERLRRVAKYHLVALVFLGIFVLLSAAFYLPLTYYVQNLDIDNILSKLKLTKMEFSLAAGAGLTLLSILLWAISAMRCCCCGHRAQGYRHL